MHQIWIRKQIRAWFSQEKNLVLNFVFIHACVCMYIAIILYTYISPLRVDIVSSLRKKHINIGGKYYTAIAGLHALCDAIKGARNLVKN